MNETKISWTDATWNPTSGCSKVSEGCKNCYAERIATKFGHTKLPWTGPNAKENIRLKAHKLMDPYKLRHPSRVFVNSMSDLFHPQIPDTFIAKVFDVMNDLPQHQFQVLTKRPKRAAMWLGPWSENIWQGTSIEDRKSTYRIKQLQQCKAQIRFLSIEPLLEPLGEISLDGIHWVIVGGESGPGYRPMNHAWAREIRDQCADAGIAFFFKQSAAFQTERGTLLEELDGSKSLYQQFPLLAESHKPPGVQASMQNTPNQIPRQNISAPIAHKQLELFPSQ